MLWFRVKILFCASAILMAQQVPYGIGRTATHAELSAWDIAVGPKGKELPSGQGSAIEGGRIYVQKCQHCHGVAGAGGKFDPLAGGGGTLATKQPLKTVGSYWPYATTVWDYINRATPQGNIGSLSHSGEHF
jgi:cytochrome c